VRSAFHEHAAELLDAELARLPPDRCRRLQPVCARVAAAVVEQVLEDALAEPRLAAALASIYGPETRIPSWPVEAARRA
jgi:hypothetical protein